MNLHEVTGLGRHIDLSLRSNRIVVLGAGAIGSTAFGVTWLGGTPDITHSALVAVGSFLAWAVARELDPDNPGTATRAMVIAGLLALFGLPAAATVAVVLLAVRVMAGTTGAPLRGADLVVLVAAAAFAGTQPLAWPAAGALGYAVWIQKPQRYPAAIAAMVLVGLVVAWVSGARPDPGLPGIAGSVMLAAVLFAGASIAKAGFIRSLTDSGEALIDPTRVSRARRTATFAVLGGSVLMASEAIGLAPVMAAILSAAMTRERTEAKWTQPVRLPQEQIATAVSVPAEHQAHSAGRVSPLL